MFNPTLPVGSTRRHGKKTEVKAGSGRWLQISIKSAGVGFATTAELRDLAGRVVWERDAGYGFDGRLQELALEAAAQF